MLDMGFEMWGSPYRMLRFCETVFPLVCMILEDIYKIVSHSAFDALKSLSTGLNYLHDFMGSGAYLISFELWKKTTFKPKPERMKGFAPKEILWNEFKDCYWDKKVWMQRDNEGTMYSEKQSGSENDIFWHSSQLTLL